MDENQINALRKKLGSVANCCAPYSGVGALFMFWVTIMIEKQQFFILGLQDPDHCQESASGAMWLFIILFSLSVFVLQFEANSQPKFRPIEQHEEHPILPPGMTDYQVNSEFELPGMMSSDLPEVN